MFVVMNRIPVNPEHGDAFETRFNDRASLVDNMDGFVAFQLLRPNNPDDPYVVMTTWESEAHFKAWTDSPEFKEGHARSGTLPPQTFLGHPKLETFDIINQPDNAD